MRKLIRIAFALSLCVPNAFAAEGADARRGKIRAWVMSHSAPIHPAIEPERNDRAADLVDELRYVSLAEMEERNLMRAQLPVPPWSDSYWPTYAGQIGYRYNDADFQLDGVWRRNFEYLSRNVGVGETEKFSPAEKYDLLVGDPSFTLTKRMIGAGSPFADAEGRVENWFGLCHGWAPASFMLPRPSKAVRVKAADGRNITFLPSDIKALSTLLWSNGAGRTKFVGGRCNDKSPDRDENSRETDRDCFDTNPATWHLAVVNQIGVSQRSFVMDASKDYEVWNQPIYSYMYVYLDPSTGERGKTLAETKVRLKDLRNDPYARFRNPRAESVVRIRMSVTYGTEVQPTTELTDAPENDSFQAVLYTYDLELDQNDVIVGGEWHSSTHPDFLWVPERGSEASSFGDEWLDSQRDRSRWDGSSPVPSSWRKAAKMSASNEQPLARIVRGLHKLANGGN